MICKKCGNNVDDDIMFCNKCGYNVKTSYPSESAHGYNQPGSYAPPYGTTQPYSPAPEYSTTPPYTPTTGYTSAPSYTTTTGYTPAPPYTPTSGYTPAPPYTPATGYTSAPPYTPATGYTPAPPYTPATGYTPMSEKPEANALAKAVFATLKNPVFIIAIIFMTIACLLRIYDGIEVLAGRNSSVFALAEIAFPAIVIAGMWLMFGSAVSNTDGKGIRSGCGGIKVIKIFEFIFICLGLVLAIMYVLGDDELIPYKIFPYPHINVWNFQNLLYTYTDISAYRSIAEVLFIFYCIAKLTINILFYISIFKMTSGISSASENVFEPGLRGSGLFTVASIFLLIHDGLLIGQYIKWEEVDISLIFLICSFIARILFIVNAKQLNANMMKANAYR